MNKNQNESVQQAAERPKTLRIILSIVIAFFVWMAAMLAAPEITKAIRDVPITVDIPTSAMLEVVDGADTKVSLVLDGKQFEIGSYGPENVRVVADASAITEPGTYEVPLVVSDNGTRSYTVTSISPATVTLTFETRATKLLQIQADITGLTTPANYIAPEDEIVLEPSTVVQRKTIDGIHLKVVPYLPCRARSDRSGFQPGGNQYSAAEFQDRLL